MNNSAAFRFGKKEEYNSKVTANIYHDQASMNETLVGREECCLKYTVVSSILDEGRITRATLLSLSKTKIHEFISELKHTNRDHLGLHYKSGFSLSLSIQKTRINLK